MRLLPERPKEGSYSILFGMFLAVLMGFGALALDVSMIRLAQSQAQDVSDAASQGALVTYRATQSTTAGASAAAAVVARNNILGGHGTIEDLEWGRWIDDDLVDPDGTPNAVMVQVGRPMPLALARLWGYQYAEVSQHAISAARPMHVVLVMDITNSWSQSNFAYARDAAVTFYDRIVPSYGPDDRLGMVVFTGRYGIVHTELLTIDEHEAAGTRTIWDNLGTASKAGWPDPGLTSGCNVHSGGSTNDFSTPEDGCFPQMWREYIDEYGTDHSTGIQMALDLLLEQPDTDQYRAMVVLTDGQPNGTGPHLQRGSYVEDRWRYYATDEARTHSGVIIDTQALAEYAWEAAEVNVWAISFVADATWMDLVARGDGYYVRTTNVTALVPIFEDIAESLPIGIVE